MYGDVIVDTFFDICSLTNVVNICTSAHTSLFFHTFDNSKLVLFQHEYDFFQLQLKWDIIFVFAFSSEQFWSQNFFFDLMLFRRVNQSRLVNQFFIRQSTVWSSSLFFSLSYPPQWGAMKIGYDRVSRARSDGFNFLDRIASRKYDYFNDNNNNNNNNK